MAISTRTLHLLPDVNRLRLLLQSMAMLDAILSPEWEYRYYSFNSHWAAGEQMGSMRDGCGNDFHVLFTASGCFIKGFAHESPMSPYGRSPKSVWPGMFDRIPAEFAEHLKEPAFVIEDTTFSIWRLHSDQTWQRGAIEFPAGKDPDGSGSLLSALDGDPATYKVWAEDYYERELPLAAVQKVYAHKSLTDSLLKSLNPNRTLAKLAADIEEIGYPGKGEERISLGVS